MKQWFVDLAIFVPMWLLICVLSVRFSRRRSKGKYVSSYDRAWQEHPEWIVVAILLGIVVAIVTVH